MPAQPASIAHRTAWHQRLLADRHRRQPARSSRYGGPFRPTESAFTLEVLQTMAEAIGAGRGRLAAVPGNPYNNVEDLDPKRPSRRCWPVSTAWAWPTCSGRARSPVQGLDAFAMARQGFAVRIANDGFDSRRRSSRSSPAAAPFTPSITLPTPTSVDACARAMRWPLRPAHPLFTRSRPAARLPEPGRRSQPWSNS
ncbi:hypothetical protein SSTU70S_00685 [Stutzerimonas stutzeri]